MPLPLTNLHIGDFRGVTNLDIEDIKRVNVLFGDNNAGKTTILEAISILSNPLDWSNWIGVAQSRDLSLLTPRKVSRIEPLMWLFPHAGIACDNIPLSPINLSCSGATRVHSLTARISEVHGSVPESPNSTRFLREIDVPASEVRTGAELTVTTLPAWQNETTATAFLWEFEEIHWEYEPIERGGVMTNFVLSTISPLDHLAGRTIIRLISQAKMKDSINSVVEILQHFDEGVVGLEVWAPTGFQPTLYVNYRDVGLMPVTAFGDGFRRALVIALTIVVTAGGVVLIEEVETAIHKDMIKHFFAWVVFACREFDVQLFVTTHSLEAVDAFVCGETNQDVAGYKLARGNYGIEIQRFGGEMLHKLRCNRGIDPT